MVERKELQRNHDLLDYSSTGQTASAAAVDERELIDSEPCAPPQELCQLTKTWYFSELRELSLRELS